MLSSRVILSLSPLLALAAGNQDGAKPGPRLQAVREVHMGSTPGTQSAHFRLDYLDQSVAQGSEPFGALRWLTGPVMGEANTWRAECEVKLLESGGRISHLEQLGPTERLLSYRELTNAKGRRLQLNWSSNGQAVSIDKGGRQRRRREYEPGPDAAMPLALVELARRGRELPDKMMVYQPLAGCFEELLIQVVPDVESRTLLLTRPDGSSAGSYRFEGNRLISFRWQAGGVIATRIERNEYLELAQPPQVIEASVSALPEPGIR